MQNLKDQINVPILAINFLHYSHYQLSLYQLPANNRADGGGDLFALNSRPAVENCRNTLPFRNASSNRANMFPR